MRQSRDTPIDRPAPPPRDATPSPMTEMPVQTDTAAAGQTPVPMERRKAIALIAHDNRKPDLLDWARFNRGTLDAHELYATGTTGGLLAAELGLSVTRFRSGPLGGDQQVGAGIAEGWIDFVIFFWDPLEPQPHDEDVKALLRVAVVYNIPVACNRATADFVLSSPLMRQEYQRLVPTAVLGTRGSPAASARRDAAPRRPGGR
jgi:methylglyoxal synthase